MKRSVLLASLILFIGVSAAQPSNSSINPEPGLVKADGLAYGLDVAWDNAMKAVGFKSPGEVAYERASEVAVARERNNTRSAVKAAENLGEVASEADNSDKAGLEKAESVLQNVGEALPEQAEYGISNALENVKQAKKRVPERMTVEGRSGGNSSGVLPDIKLPNFGGDKDIESPGSDGGSPEQSER